MDDDRTARALDDLSDAAHERGDTQVTDETLARDLTDIARDYRTEAEHGGIAYDKIASITRCFIDHGITRAAPAGGYWSDRFGG